MGKKIDSFRRTRSRETIYSTAERSDDANYGISNNNNNNINNNDNSASNNNNINVHQMNKMHVDEKTNRKLPPVCHRSPSPFKSFFIRMGSTGMLNSARNNRRSQNIEERPSIPDKESLFRSCSTSQLNSSPTYVKGDDPSEGIDLQIAARKDKTMSCDDLAGHRGNEQRAFDTHARDSSASTYSLGSPSVSFSTCDLGQTKDESFMKKSNSCDLKEAKKSSFPYAFLRSKLSVLPEERHGSLISKDERLFKTVSEEHFPTLQIEDSYMSTTTLGRKKLRLGNNVGHNDAPRNQENASRPNRASYAEFRRNSSKYEADRYSLNASRLERIEAGLQQDDTAGCYSLFDSSLLSLRENNDFQHGDDAARNKLDFAGRIESGITENCNVDFDVMAIRNDRRNSVSSCEQRLSSHYVSSNESGYDSDGPRGESVAASENEGLSIKCSSDTSSVVDSEAEKPIRSSTPNEYQDQDSGQENARKIRRNSNIDENRSDTNTMSQLNIERIDGIRWHRSGSGRMLPSIHGTFFDEDAISRLEDTQLPNCEDRLNLLSNTIKTLDVSPHRMRLQQDKTRFLSDIIQPLTRVRRCCLIELHKRNPKDSLGIRLAQQRLGDLRYIVVQLESDGIAHRCVDINYKQLKITCVLMYLDNLCTRI